MRVLFASAVGFGFLNASLAVARTMRGRGHDIACVTGMRLGAHCERWEVPHLPWRPGRDSFSLSGWGERRQSMAQAAHTFEAARAFRPDVVVGQMVTPGAALAAESMRIPFVQLGIAAYLCHPSSWHWGVARERYLDLRRQVRLPGAGTDFDDRLWTGKVHLLQSVPGLCGRAPLQAHVRFVGSCAWEPPAPDPELESWLDEQRAAGRPVVYAAPGPVFDGPPSFVAALAKVAARRDLALAVSLGRLPLDKRPALGGPGVPVFAREYVPQAPVLAHAIAVVSTGHSTSVLGALSNGIPCLLAPNGSGTPEITQLCVDAGVGIRIGGDAQEADIDEGLAAVAALAPRARVLQAEFGRYDGPSLAADYIEEVHDEVHNENARPTTDATQPTSSRSRSASPPRQSPPTPAGSTAR